MGRYINYNSSIFIVVLFCCMLLLLLLYRSCSSESVIVASVSPQNVDLGSVIQFSDSTKNAKTWFWEFGNGDSSSEKSGVYTYSQVGKYQIRLTINGSIEKRFIVNVQYHQIYEDNKLVKIIAPKTAVQDEYIIFKGDGADKDWRWEFGESGIVDAREKNTLYAFSKPGIYDVLLSTENTKYPVHHRIEILAKYMEADSTDVLTLIGNDIKEKLQNIVDGKSFNSNYNYILKEYLNNNPDATVVINNTKYNDFYSYCQGLHHIGRNVTIVENVIVEATNEQVISKIMILQSEKKR